LKALLDCAAAFHLGKEVNVESWNAALTDPDSPRSDEDEFDPDVEDGSSLDGEPSLNRVMPLLAYGGGEQGQLFGSISTLMMRLGLVPQLRWGNASGRPQLIIGTISDGMLSALVFRTALAMAKSEQIPICDGCGKVFETDRAPKRGQRKFCNTCRDSGVPQRIAQRDSRQRKRERSGDGKAR
jgi:hypothetical protein